MTPESDVRAELLEAVPALRAFARSLTGDGDTADDLVQETLVRALANLDRFEPGTSLSAWLFTILRNAFYSQYRKRRREVEDPDEIHAMRMVAAPTQMVSISFSEFEKAFAQIAPQQREALYLVEVLGHSFEEAAEVMQVALGTAKSRVIRGRARLIERLQPDDTLFYETSDGSTTPWKRS